MRIHLPLVMAVLLLASCTKDTLDPQVTPDYIKLSDTIVFAAIGDYGFAGPAQDKVADMLKSWSPDFVITLGDNNYEGGQMSSINENIGYNYCEFIYNPDAPEGYQCKETAWQDKQNRFFPSLGNHDSYNPDDIQPYLSYFTLPGNEIYYDFVWGPVHFFSINSGSSGNSTCCTSDQSIWLKAKLSTSEAAFKVVYFHHSPYSASGHGNNTNMQWPFKEWGASIVLTGHSHLYERIVRNDQPDFYYLVNGLGGKPNIYSCDTKPLPDSLFQHYCYNESNGAMKFIADKEKMECMFFGLDDLEAAVDTVVVFKGN